jgi:hypothetical protein
MHFTYFIHEPFKNTSFNHNDLAGKSESFFKNSGHFVQLLKDVNSQSQDTLVSFDVVSLFTNVPVDETLQIIENKFHNDDKLAELSILQVEAIMELL